jgi:phosphoinositide-3-kinase regulatory subunit 4
VIGTTSGVLTLWDLRFGLLLRSWTTSSAADGSGRGIHQIVSYPSKARSRHIIVAVETTTANAPRTASERLRGSITLEVWDIEKATLEETFAIAESYDNADQNKATELPTISREGRLAPTNAASAIAELIRARRAREKAQEETKQEPEMPTDIVVDPDAPVQAWMRPDVRALLALPDNNSLAQGSVGNKKELDSGGNPADKDKPRGGMLLLGTESRRIQVWDLSRLERSVVLSGLDQELGPPQYQ